MGPPTTQLTLQIYKKKMDTPPNAHLFSQNKKVKKERGKDNTIFVKVYIRLHFALLNILIPFLPPLASLGVLCIFYP
jgi:hypothetical protein